MLESSSPSMLETIICRVVSIFIEIYHKYYDRRCGPCAEKQSLEFPVEETTQKCNADDSRYAARLRMA